MNFDFTLPVKIKFGPGSADTLSAYLEERGLSRGVLVCDGFLDKSGTAAEISAKCGGRINAVFSDLVPNPTVKNVDDCAALLRSEKADFAIALGGGSTMDCAKAACAIARSGDGIALYHTGGKALSKESGIPLIAVPTTAGTGSEVTFVSVLTDEEKKLKAPLGNPLLLPELALIDPLLTLSVPAKITASTGLDVLCHALEGFWSIHHQPICDALALDSAKRVFAYLPRAFENGADIDAREQMALASLQAGIAFSHPKTTGCHACSFPLTNIWHIPHGEACALTLDYFTRKNADCEGGRLQQFARDCGFSDAGAMADEILRLKKQTGMRLTLHDMGISKADIPELSRLSLHPNMTNNPVSMDAAAIEEMYLELL